MSEPRLLTLRFIGGVQKNLYHPISLANGESISDLSFGQVITVDAKEGNRLLGMSGKKFELLSDSRAVKVEPSPTPAAAAPVAAAPVEPSAPVPAPASPAESEETVEGKKKRN